MSTRRMMGGFLIAIQAADVYFAFRTGWWGLWIVGSFFAILIACIPEHQR